MIGTVAIAALALESAQARVDGFIPQEKRTRSVLDDYAQCLVTLDGSVIRKMLLGDPRSGSFDRWRKGLNALCMLEGRDPYYTNPDNVTLRYALADVIARDLKGGPVVLDVDAVPPLTHPEPVADNGASQSQYAFASRLGECVVRKDPAGSAALLKTQIGSDHERAAIKSLLPSVGTCIPPQSEKQIDVISLRGAVALNYLRLAKEAGRAARGNPEAAE
jgi:hypothetical protein